MKVIFYFFAALNIAFFLWQSDTLGGNSGAKATSPANQKVASLVLVSEAEKIQQAGGSPQNPQVAMRQSPRDRPPSQANIAACYALGPFDDLDQAKPIAEKIRDLGAFAYERVKKQKVVSGYWVYLPAFSSWKEARKQVMDLERQGMEDLFIMGRGEMKNAVSLGLFKNESAAERRVATLKKMGVDPNLEKRYAFQEGYWIDIDIEAGKSKVVESMSDIAEGLTMLELKKRKCNE